MQQTCSSRPEEGGPLRIWSVEQLWELARALPVKRVPLASISDLDRVGWYGDERHCGRLTIRQVADHPRRIQEATFDRPIILSAEGHLMDGFHRLAKAYLLGMETIPAIQFEENPEPLRVRPVPEWLRRTL